MPLRSRYTLACLLAALSLAAAAARAQAPEALPTAPEPQIQLPAQFAEAGPAQPFADGQRGSVGRLPGRPSPIVPETQEAPTTMTPHHGGDRWWLSGQANIIFQGDLPFHSLYEGTNSFRNAAEYKTSLLGTLYGAVRPTRSIRYNTDLILDMESSGGRGLSQALGLAGFTNLDVVRNPTLSTATEFIRSSA
jgi:hypothetical protein